MILKKIGYKNINDQPCKYVAQGETEKKNMKL